MSEIDFEHLLRDLNRPEVKRFRVKLANPNIPKEPGGVYLEVDPSC